jgi:hypothetical protein
MKHISRCPAMIAAAPLWVILSVNPVEATVVYVTYTGTISSGSDPGGVFGQAGSLNGKSFEVSYVFDTGTAGSFSVTNPTENFAFGGTNFGVPSPLVDPAVLTIGGVSINIRGNSVGEIQGINQGPGAFSEQLHRAYDTNGSVVENSIFNYSGGLPASITTPFVYQVTSSDGGSSDFSAFGASGNMSVDTLTISLSAVPWHPSIWAEMIFGFLGLGFMSVIIAIIDLFYREYFKTKLAEMKALPSVPAGK